MAQWTFQRTDTGKTVEVSGNGKKHATAKAAVQLGLKAEDSMKLVTLVRVRGRRRNGRKAWKPGRARIGGYGGGYTSYPSYTPPRTPDYYDW